MPQIIPVQPVGNQTLNTQLSNQAVTLNIQQLLSGLYMTVLVNGELIVGPVICQNLNRIVRDLYFGFQGDFVWDDNEGASDPIYTGLGTRYSLIYLLPSDLPAGVG